MAYDATLAKRVGELLRHRKRVSQKRCSAERVFWSTVTCAVG